MSTASPSSLLAYGAAVVALGLVLFALEPRWVEATGTVTAVHVNTTEGRMQHGFRPFVTYRYEVDGKQYRADRSWCAPPAIASRAHREEALRDAAQIHVGDPVPILYSASSPSDATCLISRGGSELYYCGWGAVLIGAYLLFAGAHERWKARRAGPA